MVHRYAMDYFNLPLGHTVIIEDAVRFVDETKEIEAEKGKYDYIIHDVFTGGAEPTELFTLEFLSGLSLLLKFDGIVAIVRHELFKSNFLLLMPSRIMQVTCYFPPLELLSTQS